MTTAAPCIINCRTVAINKSQRAPAGATKSGGGSGARMAGEQLQNVLISFFVKNEFPALLLFLLLVLLL